MDTITSYFERLLWLIYRVFFILLFPFVFLVILFFAFDYLSNNGHNIGISSTYIYSKISILSSFNKVVFTIGICLILNLLIESFTEYYLGSDDIVESEIEEDPFYLKFKENIQSKIKLKYKTKAEIKATEISYLMRFKLMESYSSFNNYYWYIYMNYKLSSTLAAYLLLILFFTCPVSIKFTFRLDTYNTLIFFISQLVSVGIMVIAHRIFFDRIPEYGKDPDKANNENAPKSTTEQTANSQALEFVSKKKKRKNLKIAYFTLELLSLICLLLSIKYQSPISLFFSLNFGFFPFFCLLLRYSYHYRCLAKSVTVDAYISLDEPSPSTTPNTSISS